MPRFRFDTISFFIGMAVATAIWWAITLARPMLEQLLETYREKQKERALQASAGMEESHRKIIYKQTQGMHLAASLFSLDEIIEPTLLLAPPVSGEPRTGIPRRQDIVEQAVPYLPAYPEVGAVYSAATLTIPEALSGGKNLVITGQPGTGKTTALAHLASQIVNHAAEVKSLHQSIPFLIHVADLGLPLTNAQKPEEFLHPLVEKLSQAAGVFDAPRVPGFVQYAFTSGRALLLLDGVDELPQAAIQEVTTFLRVILRHFPQTRVVAAGSSDYVDGLLALGFAPVAIMPWNAEQQAAHLKKWSALWQKYVAHEAWAQTSGAPLNTVLLERWVSTDNFGLTPLEYTLKIWGAFAGDARGARAVDAIEAHIHRLTPANTPFEALYVVGAQASLNEFAIFDSRRASEWTKAFEQVAPAETAAAHAEAAAGEHPPVEAEAGAGEAAGHAVQGKKDAKKPAAPPAPAASTNLISRMVLSGLLAAHGGSRIRFAHPVFQGYLAGKGLASSPNTAAQLLKQPTWLGQTSTLRYMAAYGDATHFVRELLAMEDPILLRPTLAAARLLRDAPRNAAWRGPVMAALVQMLQTEDHPLGLRAQAMAAFATSGDPNAEALFRQLMNASSNTLRQVAALGAGMSRDQKAVEMLIDVVVNSQGAAQQAACLALVNIGTNPALEAVATALLQGDEQMRVSAAEALANHPTEGREALREGITSKDIVLRRAIVFGLARIHEPWAADLLEQTQVKDDQWAVRNVAVEILDARQQPDLHIPQRLKPASETPWLIEFAGKHGMGIIPGQPATDIFLLALKDENPEYRQAALTYLRSAPSEGVLAALYPHLFGNDSDLKEGVFQVLSEMALGGIRLPPPRQFGLG
jgi:HEAT repeat protein